MPRRMVRLGAATILAAGGAVVAAVGAVAAPGATSSTSLRVESLANRCVTVGSLKGGPVYLKATGLGGTFMLSDRAGKLVAAAPGRRIARIVRARARCRLGDARSSTARSLRVSRSAATSTPPAA